jgi:hypothetical protein
MGTRRLDRDSPADREHGEQRTENFQLEPLPENAVTGS